MCVSGILDILFLFMLHDFKKLHISLMDFEGVFVVLFFSGC